MGVGGRTRERAPFWFVSWMTIVGTVTGLLCLGMVWVLASRAGDTTRVVLWVCLGAVAVLAVLSGLFGLFRYRAVRLSLTAPLFLGLLGAAIWYDLPDRAGWQVSRGILEDLSDDCAFSGERARLGVYSIRYVERRDGGCLYYFQGEANEAEGVGYFPSTPPPYIGSPSERGITYEPYHPPWYRFVDNG